MVGEVKVQQFCLAAVVKHFHQGGIDAQKAITGTAEDSVRRVLHKGAQLSFRTLQIRLRSLSPGNVDEGALQKVRGAVLPGNKCDVGRHPDRGSIPVAATELIVRQMPLLPQLRKQGRSRFQVEIEMSVGKA